MSTLNDWLKDNVLGLSGVVRGGSPEEIGRLMFVSNEENIIRTKLREYRTWYKGDGDDLLNLYNKDNIMDFNYEPFYWKNKRSYFWSVSSTEGDIKRTHSGQPGNIINTIVGIVDRPQISVDGKGNDAVLDSILEEINFWDVYTNTQLPMTLVEGWGCWKVGWDLATSDLPFAVYYTAENVDFIWRNRKVIGVIFKDWYRGRKEGERYLVTEVRYLSPRIDETGRFTRDLHIETRAWRVNGGSTQNDTVMLKDSFDDIPELAECKSSIVVEDFNSLLATPCAFYKDPTSEKVPGRSVFQGKIDLFDDLDQEISQLSGGVRKSTPVEYFNTDFLERDPITRLPIMPNIFDRKYVKYKGGTTSDGSMNTNQPITTTQPNIAFEKYNAAILDTMSQILSGFMSLATIGINVAVQSTDKSQREKEKVTFATANHIRAAETNIIRSVVNDLMCAYEYITTAQITQKKYDVSVKWTEFANTSFEDKAAVLGGMLDNSEISPEMFITKLYGDTLSEDEYNRELEYLKKTHNPDQPQGRDLIDDGMGGMMNGASGGEMADQGGPGGVEVAG